MEEPFFPTVTYQIQILDVSIWNEILLSSGSLSSYLKEQISKLKEEGVITFLVFSFLQTLAPNMRSVRSWAWHWEFTVCGVVAKPWIREEGGFLLAFLGKLSVQWQCACWPCSSEHEREHIRWTLMFSMSRRGKSICCPKYGSRGWWPQHWGRFLESGEHGRYFSKPADEWAENQSERKKLSCFSVQCSLTREI